MSWAFEFVEVHKRVGGAGVLRGLSFGAPAHAITALHGPAASGKTLACRLVVGLERPDAGAVLVAGHDVARATGRDLRELRRRLAVVFQGDRDAGHALFERATVLENVAFPLREAGRVARRHRARAAHEALDRFGLGPYAHARPADLDPGLRKLLAVARALVLRAPVLLIDAVDDGLDAHGLSLVHTVLREEREGRGASCLLTTRDPRLAVRFADHVVAVAGDEPPVVAPQLSRG